MNSGLCRYKYYQIYLIIISFHKNNELLNIGVHNINKKKTKSKQHLRMNSRLCRYKYEK